MAEDAPGGGSGAGSTEQDYGLRAEMAASEFFMRYWPVVAGLAVVVLVGSLVYGVSQNQYVADQRRASARIDDAMNTLRAQMPEGLAGQLDIVPFLSQARAGMAGENQLDVDLTSKAADDILGIAQEVSGIAAVEGYLKAAELYRITDQPSQRRAALEGAAGSATGILRFSALAGLANLDLEEGKVDEGIARFRELAASDEDYLARQALLDLATALEALDRGDEARAAYDEYLERFPEAPDVDEVRKRRDRAGS